MRYQRWHLVSPLAPAGSNDLRVTSRAELETRGATFVSLPRAVFDELHGLAAARATGDLGSEGANLFDELIGHVARRVAAGQSPIPRRIAAAA